MLLPSSTIVFCLGECGEPRFCLVSPKIGNTVWKPMCFTLLPENLRFFPSISFHNFYTYGAGSLFPLDDDAFYAPQAYIKQIELLGHRIPVRISGSIRFIQSRTKDFTAK